MDEQRKEVLRCVAGAARPKYLAQFTRRCQNNRHLAGVGALATPPQVALNVQSVILVGHDLETRRIIH
eukprot:4833741-Lingulodinium_polyedra.AAC.1